MIRFWASLRAFRVRACELRLSASTPLRRGPKLLFRGVTLDRLAPTRLQAGSKGFSRRTVFNLYQPECEERELEREHPGFSLNQNLTKSRSIPTKVEATQFRA